MIICSHTKDRIVKLLGEQEANKLIQLSERTQKQENKNSRKLDRAVKKSFEKIVNEIVKNHRLPKDLEKYMDDIDSELMELYFETSMDALKISRLPSIRMARIPKGFIPKSLKDLRIKYDLWRKERKMTPRQKKISEKLKKEYIKRIQSVWEKKSEDFREGREFNQESVRDALKQATRTPIARANTIAATETTRYYNQARIDRYSGSEDFTHFLFLAIRDHRTTKWCKDRHGLVYRKDTEIFKLESPPAHWNCRSEVVPLSPLNPKHKKLIDDVAKLRSNNRCEPLPKGWNK